MINLCRGSSMCGGLPLVRSYSVDDDGNDDVIAETEGGLYVMRVVVTLCDVLSSRHPYFPAGSAWWSCCPGCACCVARGGGSRSERHFVCCASDLARNTNENLFSTLSYRLSMARSRAEHPVSHALIIKSEGKIFRADDPRLVHPRIYFFCPHAFLRRVLSEYPVDANSCLKYLSVLSSTLSRSFVGVLRSPDFDTQGQRPSRKSPGPSA